MMKRTLPREILTDADVAGRGGARDVRVVVITGGRDYRPGNSDEQVLRALLSRIMPDGVVHGGAAGIDMWAGRIAEAMGYHVNVERPDYSKGDESRAPLRRNTRMAHMAGRGGWCIAFPGASGTDHMVGQAKRVGLHVVDLRDLPGEEGCDGTCA
jgi:hypothetical protein